MHTNFYLHSIVSSQENFKSMRYRHLVWLGLTLIVGLQSTSAWAQLTPDQQKIQELEKKIEGSTGV